MPDGTVEYWYGNKVGFTAWDRNNTGQFNDATNSVTVGQTLSSGAETFRTNTARTLDNKKVNVIMKNNSFGRYSVSGALGFYDASRNSFTGAWGNATGQSAGTAIQYREDTVTISGLYFGGYGQAENGSLTIYAVWYDE